MDDTRRAREVRNKPEEGLAIRMSCWGSLWAGPCYCVQPPLLLLLLPPLLLLLCVTPLVPEVVEEEGGGAIEAGNQPLPCIQLHTTHNAHMQPLPCIQLQLQPSFSSITTLLHQTWYLSLVSLALCKIFLIQVIFYRINSQTTLIDRKLSSAIVLTNIMSVLHV